LDLGVDVGWSLVAGTRLPAIAACACLSLDIHLHWLGGNRATLDDAPSAAVDRVDELARQPLDADDMPFREIDSQRTPDLVVLGAMVEERRDLVSCASTAPAFGEVDLRRPLVVRGP
jgi:hypothetical protein